MRLILIAAAAGAAAALSACADVDAPPPEHMVASAAEPAAAANATYLAEAGRSDLYEIRASQLLLSRSTNPDVREVATMMVRDHTNSTTMLLAAAQGAGLAAPPPPMLDARRQALIDQLQTAAAADVDRLYLHQQLMAHQEAWALHNAYAQGGEVPALRSTAAQIAGVVQQHLVMLRSRGAS